MTPSLLSYLSPTPLLPSWRKAGEVKGEEEERKAGKRGGGRKDKRERKGQKGETVRRNVERGNVIGLKMIGKVGLSAKSRHS